MVLNIWIAILDSIYCCQDRVESGWIQTLSLRHFGDGGSVLRWDSHYRSMLDFLLYYRHPENTKKRPVLTIYSRFYLYESQQQKGVIQKYPKCDHLPAH